MPQFMFAYHGGKMPETPEEGQAVMAAWTKWFGDLGKAAVQPGAPVGQSMTVNQDSVEAHGGSNPLSGYSIVEAGDMDEAVSMAKGCPILEHGSVEVAEIKPM